MIGTSAPKHHAALRTLGVLPLDYGAADLTSKVLTLAPTGVNAVFDHLGLKSARSSFALLTRGGSLLAYGNAAIMNSTESMGKAFVSLLFQIALWNIRRNDRSATFYNFWEGSRVSPKRFHRYLREDLSALLDLLAKGAISPVIAARFPLVEAAAAMILAESRTIQGKVILLP